MKGHSSIATAPLFGALCALGVLIAPITACGQSQPIRSKPVDLTVDSGSLDNDGAEPRVVWSEIIQARGAGWLRLYIKSADLDPDLNTAETSVLRIMSLQDGGVQHLNAGTLAQWQNSTAYFNGETLSVELIARPHSRGNRVVLSRVDVGIDDDLVGPASICGTTDDRLLSADPRSARALPIGCSAWIIDDPNHQFITAGHCSTSSLQVISSMCPSRTVRGAL